MSASLGRVIIATQTYHPTANGQGAFTVQLAEGLARAGLEVYVLTLSGHPNDELREQNGVHVCWLSSITIGIIDDHLILPLPGGEGTGRLLEAIEPEIVHIQDHYVLGAKVAHAALRRKVPTLGTNHFLPENMIPYFPVLANYDASVRFLRQSLWGQVLETYNQLDYVVAPTTTAAAILRRNGLTAPLGVISNGVDVQRFSLLPHLDRGEVRRRFGLDPQAVLFLYVGRVDREKRIDTLVRAASRLGQTDIQIGIAGRGNYAKRLKRLAERLGLGDRVVFTGYVPGKDLPPLLNSADVFVMPSPVELQSIATLEAMGTGLPVLAARAGALPEIVREDQNGCLFEPGDAVQAAARMKEMASRPEALLEMGRASRRLVEQHGLPNTIRSYLELYQRLNSTVRLEERVRL